MRTILAVTLLVLAGCASPEYTAPSWGGSGEPWDTTWLIEADVSSVDLLGVAATLETHYWDFAQADGVCVEPRRSDVALADPDGWDTGGDSGIFTGMALATWSFRYGVDKTPQTLEHVIETLRGLWLVTHAAGPGVLCRIAFDKAHDAEFSWPDRWGSRIDSGFVGESSGQIEDPIRGGLLPPMRFYTRATKDQLTGILLGLSAAWKIVGPDSPLVTEVVRQCAADVYAQLDKHDFYIRDARGKNDTSADYVDGLLKTQLLTLMTATQGVDHDEFDVSGIADWFNVFSNYSQYYAWNLRYSRALSIWLLETNEDRRAEVEDFVGDLWDNTSEHQSAWFAAVRGALSDEDVTSALTASLKSLGLKPLRNYSSPYRGQQFSPSVFEVLFGLEAKYVLPPHLRKPTGYFTWQKMPWDVQDAEVVVKEPQQDAVGLDFLLPYWAGQYFGAL